MKVLLPKVSPRAGVRI